MVVNLVTHGMLSYHLVDGDQVMVGGRLKTSDHIISKGSSN